MKGEDGVGVGDGVGDGRGVNDIDATASAATA